MPNGEAKASGCTASGCKDRISRRGRPVQMDHAQRETMVLDAAAHLLTEKPLDEVTMSAIARRVRMSKRTVYTLFSSREALLGACLARVGASLFRPLEPEDHSKPLSDRLRKLLTVNRVPFLQAAPLEILRVVIAQAHTYPDLARNMTREGHDKLVQQVARELLAAERSGEVSLGATRADEAAELLVDMIFGGAVRYLLDPSRTMICEEDKAARRDCAISIFMRGLACKARG